jgi:hypothetical protein
LSILLQHAPATAELILVYLSAGKALLENLERIDPRLSRSATSCAATPFVPSSTSVVTVVGAPFVAVWTTRSFVFMPVLPVLGTGPDA